MVIAGIVGGEGGIVGGARCGGACVGGMKGEVRCAHCGRVGRARRREGRDARTRRTRTVRTASRRPERRTGRRTGDGGFGFDVRLALAQTRTLAGRIEAVHPRLKRGDRRCVGGDRIARVRRRTAVCACRMELAAFFPVFRVVIKRNANFVFLIYEINKLTNK